MNAGRLALIANYNHERFSKKNKNYELFRDRKHTAAATDIKFMAKKKKFIKERK